MIGSQALQTQGEVGNTLQWGGCGEVEVLGVGGQILQHCLGSTTMCSV